MGGRTCRPLLVRICMGDSGDNTAGGGGEQELDHILTSSLGVWSPQKVSGRQQ